MEQNVCAPQMSQSEWEKLCQHYKLQTKCDFFSQPPDVAVPPETESHARSSCEAPVTEFTHLIIFF